MLAEMLYEETGKATTTRVLSADASGIDVEITLQTKGKIMGVEQNSAWTYNSNTGPDGAIRGEGTGFMTTKNGDLIALKGHGNAKGADPDGSVHFRGVIFFQTTSAEFAHLNGMAGAFEYDVDPAGNTTTKVWEWR